MSLLLEEPKTDHTIKKMPIMVFAVLDFMIACRAPFKIELKLSKQASPTACC
jgi:hypothetical protein